MFFFSSFCLVVIFLKILFSRLFGVKSGFWLLWFVGCFGIVFGSVLLVFLFGLSLFVDFAFETLCHEVGFCVTASLLVASCFVFLVVFCLCFCLVLLFLWALLLRLFAIKWGSWSLLVVGRFLGCFWHCFAYLFVRSFSI